MTRSIRHLTVFVCGAVAAVALVMLMAPTVGFPSRPQFQNVGIGIAPSTLGARLRVAGNPPGPGQIEIRGYTTGVADSAYIGFADSSGTRVGMVGNVNVSSPGLSIVAEDANGNIFLNANGAGTVQANGVSLQRGTVSQSAPSGAGMLIGDTIIVSKSADTARASTITPTSDPHLQITSLPAGHYKIAVRLSFTATVGTGGYRWQFNAPSVVALGTAIVTCNTAFSALEIVSAADNVCTGASGGRAHYMVHGASVKAQATGTIAIAWAQNASNVTATNLLADSWLEVTRIN